MVVLVAPVVPMVLVLVVVVLGLTVLVPVVGLRAADVALVAPAEVRFSPGLEGLDRRVLVRREAVDVVDFFSSSLALTLGRLRWVEVEVAVVGRRVVVVVPGGRVGGLLRPPVAREVAEFPAVLDAVVEVAGRRTVLVVVVPGRLVVVVVVEILVGPLDLGAGAASGLGSGAADTSGEEGVGVPPFSWGASEDESRTSAAASGWTTSTFSISDMVESIGCRKSTID